MEKTTGCEEILIEEKLAQLHLNYRKIVFAKGALFFCTSASGRTFNIIMGADGKIKLWRFACTVDDDKAYYRLQYHMPCYPHMALGMEVTEDGDLCVYTEQMIRQDDPRREQRIRQMIQGYYELICTGD